MSDTTLRNSIASMLQEVPGIGIVHKYERWTKDMSQFLTMFQDPASKKIFGWEITRAGIGKIEKITQKFKVPHLYKLKGYYGLQDSAQSEIEFNAIVDGIVLKFISKQIPGTEMKTWPRAPRIEPRVFGSVLCHYAEMDFEVPEIVAKVTDEEINDLLRVGLNYYLKQDEANPDAQDLVTLQ
jgi:hypothetical protein